MDPEIAPSVMAGARISVAIVFLLAASQKAQAPSQFAQELRSFGIPRSSTLLIAWLTISVEVLLGFALLARLAQPLPAAASVALLVIFTGAVALRWRRTGAFDCGCFGESASARPWLVFPRNALLGVLALSVLRDLAPWTLTTALAGAVLAVTLGVAATLLAAATEPKVWSVQAWTG